MITVVKYETGVVTLKLNRPPANAFDAQAIDQLFSHAKQIHNDPQIRALIITAEGKFFSAGADIGFMAEAQKKSDGPRQLAQLAKKMQDVFLQIANLPIPTVAAISGIATGGGLELAMACDFRIATHNAKLGLPECKIGLLPGAGGTQRLTALVGAQIAKRLIMTGELIGADQAKRIGLVDEVTTDADALSTAHGFCEPFLLIPAITLAAIKNCIAYAPSERGYEIEIEETYNLQAAPSTAALMNVFLNRNKKEVK